MSIVTFISDFGTKDHYVAAVKAVLVSSDPRIQIIDISHQVQPYDIGHAGYLLQNVFRDFPPDTVHICAINNVAKRQISKLVAVKLEGHYFVGHDSGIFNLVSEKKPEAIVNINKTNLGMSTFEAKDILAPVAGALAKGEDIYSLGTEIDELELKFGLKPKISKKEIEGKVVRIDCYGNLITNIPKPEFDKILGMNNPKTFKIKFARESSQTIDRHYQDVGPGSFYIIFNSMGWLQIGVNQGNASELFGMTQDQNQKVNICFGI